MASPATRTGAKRPKEHGAINYANALKARAAGTIMAAVLRHVSERAPDSGCGHRDSIKFARVTREGPGAALTAIGEAGIID